MWKRLLPAAVIAVVLSIVIAWLAWPEAPGDDSGTPAIDSISQVAAPARPSAPVPRGRVSGQVRHDDQGVGAATVTARSAEQTLQATTLDDGSFLFDDVPVGELYLSAFAQGLASDTVGPLTLRAQERLEGVVLVLTPSQRVNGRVVDLVTRAPIAGALVVTAAARLRTDADGRFVLLGARGETWLAASAPGYRSRTEWVAMHGADQGASLEVLLAPASRLSGVVREGGAPAPGATVWAEVVVGPSRGERSLLAISDAKGQFTLEAPDGLLLPQAVSQRGSRLLGKELRLGIGEHREGLVIEGDSPTGLEGVVRRDGAPLAGALLGFVEAGTEQVQANATSGPGGRFQVPSLRKGKYLVQVGLGAFTALAGPFTHQGDGVPWAVDVRSGLVLQGRVEPVSAGVRVRWRSGEWSGPAAETVTDAAGRFIFEGVPAGQLSLDAEGPGGAGTARARAGEEVVLRLARGMIEVRVREEGGGLVTDAAVVARSLETGAVRRVLGVAAGGAFRVEVPPGPWEVWAEVPGRGRSSSQQVTVGAEPAQVELSLPVGVSFVGTVRDAESKLPLQGALVYRLRFSDGQTFYA